MRLGVWEKGMFIGAIVFGCGASSRPGDQFGVKTIEVCELCRVALRAHALPVTRILKVAMNFLRRGAPGIRIVVSYADPQQGHYGGIYQAGNWTPISEPVAGSMRGAAATARSFTTGASRRPDGQRGLASGSE